MKLIPSLFFCLIAVICMGCKQNVASSTVLKDNYSRAKATLEAVYTNYSIDGTPLLRENYPFTDDYKAGYLANNEQQNRPNPYSYLWPFSGSLSSIVAMCEVSSENKIYQFLEEKVLPGLEMYYDTRRSPDAYASYINTAPLSDRFYDDNVWLGLDFTDLYRLTNKKSYLDKALVIWKFIESGTDNKLDDGIYWCEQKRRSKHACSNAPGSVFALKLFMATGDSTFFNRGKKLYTWTKTNLQDPADHLYYDNIRLDGSIERHKFTYNSGQMLQSATLLYRLTGDEAYLQDARDLARSCYTHFFEEFVPDGNGNFRILKETDIWFIAVMSRGFFELYEVDGNREYIDAFQTNLNYAWEHMRDDNGLFNKDWKGERKESVKWLLHQFGMAELYARMAKFD